MSKKIVLSLALLFTSAVPLYAQDASTQTDFAQQEVDQRNEALLAAFQAGLQNFAAACQKGSRDEVKAALEALIALEPCAGAHEMSAAFVKLHSTLFGNDQERLAAAVEGVRQFAQDCTTQITSKALDACLFGLSDCQSCCSPLEKARMLPTTVTRQEFLDLMQEVQNLFTPEMQEGANKIRAQFLKNFATFYAKTKG